MKFKQVAFLTVFFMIMFSIAAFMQFGGCSDDDDDDDDDDSGNSDDDDSVGDPNGLCDQGDEAGTCYMLCNNGRYGCESPPGATSIPRCEAACEMRGENYYCKDHGGLAKFSFDPDACACIVPARGMCETADCEYANDCWVEWYLCVDKLCHTADYCDTWNSGDCTTDYFTDCSDGYPECMQDCVYEFYSSLADTCTCLRQCKENLC